MRLNGTSLTFGSGRMYDRRVSLLPLPERMTRNPSLHLRTVFTPVTRIMFGQTSFATDAQSWAMSTMTGTTPAE